jgi:hypothetical protein
MHALLFVILFNENPVKGWFLSFLFFCFSFFLGKHVFHVLEILRTYVEYNFICCFAVLFWYLYSVDLVQSLINIKNKSVIISSATYVDKPKYIDVKYCYKFQWIIWQSPETFCAERGCSSLLESLTTMDKALSSISRTIKKKNKKWGDLASTNRHSLPHIRPPPEGLSLTQNACDQKSVRFQFFKNTYIDIARCTLVIWKSKLY